MVRDTSQRPMYGLLFAVSVAHLLNDMMQSVVPSIYPLIKDRFGFTFAQIGVITLVFQLTSSILQPFVGLYMDKRPKPYSLAIGMGFAIIGLLILAFANNFALIILAVCTMGCCSSIFHPCSTQVAQMVAGEQKGLAQSIFQIGGNAGMAVGPLLVALIVIPYGQSAISWLTLFALLAAVILLRVGSWYRKRLSDAAKRVKESVANSVRAFSKRKVGVAMFILVVIMFSKNFYTACMTNYFTFFLIDKFGMSIQNSQFCLFAFLAASAVGTVIGGALGDRFGRKYVILASVVGAAPFALVLPYVNVTAAIVLAIVIGVVISSSHATILVYATDLMPDKVGTIAGMFFGLSFGIAGLGAAFFGWLADRTGIELVFRICTLLPLIGIVAAFLPNVGRVSEKAG